MSPFTRITVLGTGVLGSQIAFQTAYSGHPVVAYDIDEKALENARTRFADLAETYRAEVDGAADGKADAALARITLSSDLAEAVTEADLVIEAVPESIEIKRDIYTRLAEVAPAGTVFATNSSTLLPSQIADATGRPEKFLALHFANRIWAHNTAEVMSHPGTDPDVFAAVSAFAAGIGMVPIEIRKEQPGYVLNSLLVPFYAAAGQLWVDGIAEPDAIDATWRIGTGSPYGPFQIYDIVGMTTMYNIFVADESPASQQLAAAIKERMIDQGKMGISTGQGFYEYAA